MLGPTEAMDLTLLSTHLESKNSLTFGTKGEQVKGRTRRFDQNA